MLNKFLQAAAGNAAEPMFVESVFSTYLYTGNGSTQTITNGIDLAGEGGLVWIQSRSNAYGGYIYDTARGTNKRLYPFSTNGQFTATQDVTAFNSNGFTMGSETGINGGSGQTYASWTFRKAEKFFDVVTYTGDGANRAISHNLGSVPGFIIVKSTSAADLWECYHRSLGPTQYIRLDSTNAAAAASSTHWQNTTPTSTEFYVGTTGALNTNGVTYVAYLFAHDAGGFGDDGLQNVVSCGSFIPSSTWGSVIDIGFEPQWLLYKKATGLGEWNILDNMRGIATGGADNYLTANSSASEIDYVDHVSLHAKGFQQTFSSVDTNTYIYIAIRRGPMKTPTTGTQVFAPKVRTGTASNTTVGNFGFPIDLVTSLFRAYPEDVWFDRLRGATKQIKSTETSAESTQAASIYGFDVMDGYKVGIDNVTNMTNGNTSASGYVNYAFRRATGFFDVVAYSGNSTAGHEIKHNLGVTPEFMIQKVRNDTTSSWYIYHKDLNVDGDGLAETDTMRLYLDSAAFDYPVWNDTAPTSTSFYLGGGSFFNQTGDNYITYLFATLAGVSKVGSYTGTGSNVNVDCGFSAGARFVLIKRTDSTGDWYVWDSVRGIVAGNDPYLLLNSTAAEVTSTDYIDPLASGFTVTSSAPAALNASGGTYIFLAIA